QQPAIGAFQFLGTTNQFRGQGCVGQMFVHGVRPRVGSDTEVPGEGNRSSNRWGRPTRLVRHGPKSTLDRGQSSSTTASHTSIHETEAKGPAACAQQDLGIRPKKDCNPARVGLLPRAIPLLRVWSAPLGTHRFSTPSVY